MCGGTKIPDTAFRQRKQNICGRLLRYGLQIADDADLCLVLHFATGYSDGFQPRKVVNIPPGFLNFRSFKNPVSLLTAQTLHSSEATASSTISFTLTTLNFTPAASLVTRPVSVNDCLDRYVWHVTSWLCIDVPVPAEW
jgi:hypothetical protein